MDDKTKQKISNSMRFYYDEHPEKRYENTSAVRKYCSDNAHPMLGKHHSDEAKHNMSVFRSGKTYDEIMFAEVASRLKELHRERFTGSGNPRYIPIDGDLIIQAIQSEQSIRDAARRVGMSYSGFYGKCKSIFGKTPGEIKKGSE